MAKPKTHRLGDLQLKIMKVLWEQGEATVAAVQEAWPGDLAYTTVATMLRRMEIRGLVKHRKDGRGFVYRAAVKAEAVSRSVAHHLLERLCEGSVIDAVHHLLTTRDVSHAELAQLEKMIAERKKRL
jgi:predicted transcriptional regulator